MEDKKLTPLESMAIITKMIDASKQRIPTVDLRVSIMWATLSIVTAAAVLILGLTTYAPWVNFLWFAILIIGLPAQILMTNNKHRSGAKTYIDTISDGIWKIVGFIAIFLTAICAIFHFSGYPRAWLSMLLYAFIIVGSGAAMQGIVIKENSYVFGGVLSVLVGFIVAACAICGIPLLAVYIIPVYIACFLLMFIVPAFIIRKKFNRDR